MSLQKNLEQKVPSVLWSWRSWGDCKEGGLVVEKYKIRMKKNVLRSYNREV